MKNNKLLILIVALTFTLFTSSAQKSRLELTPVMKYGQLSVKGNRIVDKNGNPVQLRGMSFFWSQWMGKYFTPGAVKWLKDDWNCSVIRAVMGVEAGGYLANPSAEKQKIITLVDAAIKEGLYVIIDWHDHHAQDHTKESKAFFAEMAKRYGDKPNVIYELYNEPVKVHWAEVIKPYSEAVIDTLRRYDPDNIIVCGTPNWSQDVDVAAKDPLKGINLAYSLHFYSGTHKDTLRAKATEALSRGVALFVTEFGTTEASGNGNVYKSETLTWWKFLDDNQISWCNWSIADKAETSAALSPGTEATGDWPVSNLTESGAFVRDELKAKNSFKK